MSNLKIFPDSIKNCPLKDVIEPKKIISNDKMVLHIDFDKCLCCTNCEIVCPEGLSPFKDRFGGILKSDKCIKCATCILNCPSRALTFKMKNNDQESK